MSGITKERSGTGFDTKKMKEVFAEVKNLKEIKKPIKEKVLDEKQTIWVEPTLVCEIEYASMTEMELV
ncbi:MAG: hypothetical protein IPL53_09420 [Ignavibacteria bacterium]|nr:hypothetical protein [Ignavibacteria bacterium]